MLIQSSAPKQQSNINNRSSYKICVRSVCYIQEKNGENWLASGSNGKTIRILYFENGNQINHQMKNLLKKMLMKYLN